MRCFFYAIVLFAAPLVTHAAQWSYPQAQLGGDYWRATERGDAGTSQRVWGLVDLHAHYFTHLAYGGRVLHGQVSAPAGIAEALDDCGHDHGGVLGHTTAYTPDGFHRTGGYPGFESWPRYDTLTHQQAYVDWIRRAWQGGLRIVQMDVQNTEFLGRAFATINRLLVRGNPLPLPSDDASAVWLQTDAARKLFGPGGAASDFAAIARTPGEARAIIQQGKLAVVLGIEVEALANLMHPEQLGSDPRGTISSALDELWRADIRHVIPIHLTRNAFGHPAVSERVLNSVNYAVTGRWYAMGDGYADGLRFDPRFVTRDPVSWFFELMGNLTGQPGLSPLRAARSLEGLSVAGEILIQELIARGFIVDIEHMSELAKNRTLDIAEHVGVPIMASHAGFRDLVFGNQLSYQEGSQRGYGSYAAHAPEVPFAQARANEYGTSDSRRVRTERQHSPEQLERIRRLGGMVGLAFPNNIAVSWRGQVPADCDATSKAFAQTLLYLSEMMGGQGIGIGSDINGFSVSVGPRFGVEACPGSQGDKLREGLRRSQALVQRNGVAYTTPVSSVGTWRFSKRDGAYSWLENLSWQRLAQARAAGRRFVAWTSADRLALSRWEAMEGNSTPLARSRAGTREWDINLDGLAHYGMIPDMMQDTANVIRGAAGAEIALSALFNGAEDYLQMWEKIAPR